MHGLAVVCLKWVHNQEIDGLYDGSKVQDRVTFFHVTFSRGGDDMIIERVC